MFGSMMILRLLRVRELVRGVRTVSGFRELWIMVQGFTDSGKLLVWTYAIVGLVHLLFGLLLLHIVGSSGDLEGNEYVGFSTVFGRTCSIGRFTAYSARWGILCSRYFK